MRWPNPIKRNSPSFTALDVLRDLLHVADLFEHVNDGFVRAAVQRARERGGSRGDGGVGVGVRAADLPYRGRRAVLLVIRVQDEQHVERALERGVRLVAELGHLEEHRQEVSAVARLLSGCTYGWPKL
jgi:hypothetical protein